MGVIGRVFMLTVDDCDNSALHDEYDYLGYRGVIGALRNREESVYVYRVHGVEPVLEGSSTSLRGLREQFEKHVNNHIKTKGDGEAKIVPPTAPQIRTYGYSFEERYRIPTTIHAGSVLAVSEQDAREYIYDKYGLSPDALLLGDPCISPTSIFVSEATDKAKDFVQNL